MSKHLKHLEATILSRLAMMKVAGNVGERFNKAKNILDGRAWEIADNIENNYRYDDTARSFLEWAEYELGEEQ